MILYYIFSINLFLNKGVLIISRRTVCVHVNCTYEGNVMFIYNESVCRDLFRCSVVN